MSILDFVPPGWELRPEQRDFLLWAEANWDKADVLVCIAPTATGKTLLSYVIARWRAAAGKGASIIHPTNVLVDQFHAAFPDVTVMHRQEAYRCEDFKRSCAATKARCKRNCFGCPYTAAKKEAKQAPIRLANYWTYWSQKLFSETLIVDEAHQLVEMLAEVREVKLWGSQFKFPDGLRTVADVILWAEQHAKATNNDRLRAVIRDIVRIQDGAVVEYAEQIYRGNKERLLVVRHQNAASMPPWLWPPGKVRKIVLLSATTGHEDVRELGLGARRVAMFECEAPIPVSNRPVRYEPAANLAFRYVDQALPLVARKIDELLARHPEKGLIHVPYNLAARLMPLLSDKRLIWHTRANKSTALDYFRESAPEEGRVLVASGLYEGVDLPYDAARWGALVKVPFASLADARVKARADADPDWYAWTTLKKIIQGAGRQVRAVDDMATFYILDSNFKRLVIEDDRRPQPLIPRYFRAAIQGLR